MDDSRHDVCLVCAKTQLSRGETGVCLLRPKGANPGQKGTATGDMVSPVLIKINESAAASDRWAGTTSENRPQTAVPWRPLYSTEPDLSRSRRTVNIRDMRHEDGVGDDPSHATGGMTAHEDAFPIPAAELQPRSYSWRDGKQIGSMFVSRRKRLLIIWNST